MACHSHPGLFGDRHCAFQKVVDAFPVVIDIDNPLTAAGRSSKSEALEALQSLGYKAGDAENMIRQANKDADEDMSAAALIKKALQASVNR